MAFRLAAELTVAVHLVFVAFLLGGGFLAWRRPHVLLVHLSAVAISAVIAVAGFDCPLTDLEKWLRARAGVASYPDGFVSHYLVRPVHPAGVTPALDLGLLVVTVAVTALAYAGLVAQWSREDPAALRRSYDS